MPRASPTLITSSINARSDSHPLRGGHLQFDSLDFYRQHAQRYSLLSHEYTHSAYTRSTHSDINGDPDLIRRAVELAPGRRGLGAGCGAGARDVYLLHPWG